MHQWTTTTVSHASLDSCVLLHWAQPAVQQKNLSSKVLTSWPSTDDSCEYKAGSMSLSAALTQPQLTSAYYVHETTRSLTCSPGSIRLPVCQLDTILVEGLHVAQGKTDSMLVAIRKESCGFFTFSEQGTKWQFAVHLTQLWTNSANIRRRDGKWPNDQPFIFTTRITVAIRFTTQSRVRECGSLFTQLLYWVRSVRQVAATFSARQKLVIPMAPPLLFGVHFATGHISDVYMYLADSWFTLTAGVRSVIVA